MKISILLSSLSGGGAERVVCNLSNYLADKGHDVTILTFSAQKTYYLSDKVTHIPLYDDVNKKGNFLIKNITRIYKLRKYFKKQTPDVYMTFLPTLSKVMLSNRKLIRCPVILAERADPATYCTTDKDKEKIVSLFSKADAYVFQTEDARKYYNEVWGLKKDYETVIPNAINEEFIGKVYEGEREKVIVSAGRMNSQKNFPLLINSFNNIKDEFPEYNLCIYGGGALLESNRELAKSLGMESRVEFPGYVTDIGDKIKDASLFVLSSDYEGMPNALMEAMAVGLPCISTDCPVGGPKFLIDDGINGLLTEVGNEKHLTDAIRKMLSDYDKALSMGKEATKISDTLSPDRIYGQWEKFIYDVVKGGEGSE